MGQFTTYRSSNLYAGGPGYTVNGRLTFGAAAGLEKLKDRDKGITAVSVNLSYVPIKQTEKIPVSLFLGGSLQQSTAWNITVNSSSMTAALLHKAYSIKRSTVVPAIFVGWSQSRLSSGGPVDSRTGFGIQLSLLFRRIHFTPSISFPPQGAVFSLSAGLLYPKLKSK